MTKTAKKRKVTMPAGIRHKLSAAICMLLVSSIMLVSSTYAWFTLSTAPEASNIATTVTGNGSLEIALVPTSGLLGEIKSSLSGSQTNVTVSNVNWGNVVNLDSTTYGLSQISLLPSTLTDEFTKITGAGILSTALYGKDGRVTELDNNTTLGSWDTVTGKFVNADTSGYGVRAIGVADNSTQAMTTYGYLIDLAMRINTTKEDGSAGNLLLQTLATQRIGESESENTMGGGSYMEFTSANGADITDLMNAIRVTFVANLGKSGTVASNYSILGTARLKVGADTPEDSTLVASYILGKDAYQFGYTLGKDAYEATDDGSKILGQDAYEAVIYHLGKDAYTYVGYRLGQEAYEQQYTLGKDAYQAFYQLGQDAFTPIYHLGKDAYTKSNGTYTVQDAYTSANSDNYAETLSQTDYEKLSASTGVAKYQMTEAKANSCKENGYYVYCIDAEEKVYQIAENESHIIEITEKTYQSLSKNTVRHYHLTTEAAALYNDNNSTNYAATLDDLNSVTEETTHWTEKYVIREAHQKVYGLDKNSTVANGGTDWEITNDAYAKLDAKTQRLYQVASNYYDSVTKVEGEDGTQKSVIYAGNCDNYPSYTEEQKTATPYLTDGIIDTAAYNALNNNTTVTTYGLKSAYVVAEGTPEAPVTNPYTNYPTTETKLRVLTKTEDETVESTTTALTITAANYATLKAATSSCDYKLTDNAKTVYNANNSSNYVEGLTTAEYNALVLGATSEGYILSAAAKLKYSESNTLAAEDTYVKGSYVESITQAQYSSLDDETVTPSAKAYLYLYDEVSKDWATSSVLLTSLTKNEAVQISAIVWLDGDAVNNSDFAATAQSLTGTLNLQFTTDILLDAADNEALYDSGQ